jgi:NarL family two-component system response regulator LiaR
MNALALSGPVRLPFWAWRIARRQRGQRGGRSVSGPIRLLVTDDHAIVRKGIVALLATEPTIEVVGEAGDGREAIEQARRLAPDVILMDLLMPCVDGLGAIRAILADQPQVRILVLTSFASDDKIFPAIRAGAVGYLLKDSGPEQLVQAIHHVFRGESSLDPGIARRLVQEFSSWGKLADARDRALTEREREVLQLVAQGATNREVAERLSISEATVRSHVRSILRKLRLSSRTQAALYALREGLASLGEVSLLLLVL